MGQKPGDTDASLGRSEVFLVPWQPSATATPPVELRRPFTGRLLTAVGATVLLVAFLMVFGLFTEPLGAFLLAVLVVVCGLVGVVWVMYSAAVESLTLGERVLLQRRWWGAMQRTPLEDIATVVYLPKHGSAGRGGWEYRPFLVLLDAQGRRLHKLRCAHWSEPQLETLAALVPAATKLKVPGRVDPIGLRQLDQHYPGIRRRG